MNESKKRRQKQPGKLMAKSCSQLINLPGARPLMNPLQFDFRLILVEGKLACQVCPPPPQLASLFLANFLILGHFWYYCVKVVQSSP